MVEQVGEQDALSIYTSNERAADGVELSTAKEELLTLVGRDSSGKTTFVMTLTTELLPGSNSVKIASIDMMREPKLSKSENVVAIVSNKDQKDQYS